jgi:polyvinyl alcohol dehydrogenase (cytochrome)
LATEQDGATNILIGDLNGDGKADMAASRGHSKGVVWFEAPRFTMREIDPNIEGPHSLAMADIDKDGDLDIATCGKDSKEAAWYENDGKGKFTRHLMGANQASYDVRLVDMNGDGYLDFLVCGENSKNVVWYENPGRPRAQGAALYKKACASCHESQGPSRIPSREALAGRSPESIVRSLTSGVMHAQGKSLTPADHALIAEYLTGKQPGEASAGLANPCGSSPPFARRDSGWIGWSPDLRNTRFQPNAGLTAGDVPRLRLKWAFGFEGDTVAFASPSVTGGRLFTGSQSGRVFSLDAKTGCSYWMYDAGAGVRTAVEIDAGGVAYFGDLRAQVHAVDASNGNPLWKVRVDDHPHARITGSPRLHEGVLYVPVASFEESAAADPKYPCCSFRGSVVALDTKNGNVLWKTWMIGRAARETGINRGGSKKYGPSGIGVWVAPTIDPERPLLYVATGDNYSEPATNHSDAVIALDRKTGRIVWSKQLTPNDIWNASCPAPGKDNCPDGSGPDADFGAAPVLVDVGGGKRLLLAGQKSGVVWALDPDRGGAVVWSRRVGKGGALGGIQWGIASDGARAYAGVSDVEWFHFGGRLRGGFRIDPSKGGGLHAVDVRTGAVSWSAAPSSCEGREKCSPAQSGAVTAMPGAVLSGSYDGFVRAYETNAGGVVWEFDTRREFQTVNGVKAKGGSLDSAGPVIAEGMVFVNSGYGTFGGEAGNVLLAFGPEAQ